MWFWWLACTPESTVELTISLSQPTEVAPLVRRLHAEANVPVSLTAEWVSGDHTVTATWPQGEAVQDHLLLGMRTGREYTLTVTAVDENGIEATAEDTFTTVEGREHFPQSEVIAGVGARQEGDTLVPMHSFIAGTGPSDLAAIWDEEGNLIYWLVPDGFLNDVQEYEGGLLALVGDRVSRLVHYGWDGTEIASWSIAPEAGADHVLSPVDVTTFHHDVGSARFEPGQFVGLGRKAEAVPEYPLNYEDPDLLAARPAVALDAVLVFDEDGTVLEEVRIDDLIPVTHIGYDSLSLTIEGWADWAHANAVIEDDDGDWIVSLRHLDTVMKIDKETHEIVWLLANHENWPVALQDKLLTPVGDLRWQYHQHGPEVLPPGPNGEVELAVFDNGNAQASPFTGEPQASNPFSRVVQFEIDEAAMTVRQVWEFGDPSGGRLYSEAVGNADPLENGNVLSAWGFLDELPDGTGNLASGLGLRSVRIIEIDPATQDEVEQLYLFTDGQANDKGWTGYRAERIANFEGRIVD